MVTIGIVVVAVLKAVARGPLIEIIRSGLAGQFSIVIESPFAGVTRHQEVSTLSIA
jgi:hypothetical protein